MKTFTNEEIQRLCFLNGIRYHLSIYKGPGCDEVSKATRLLPNDLDIQFDQMEEYCFHYAKDLNDEEFESFAFDIIPEGYIRFELIRRRRHLKEKEKIC